MVQLSYVSLNSAITYRLIAYHDMFDPIGTLMGKPCIPEVTFSGIVCDLRGKNVKDFNTGNVGCLVSNSIKKSLSKQSLRD